MPRPLALVAAPAIAALGFVALPAGASASAIAPAEQCVSSLFSNGNSSRQPMTGTITGGTPGGVFTISGKDGEASFFSGTFDGAGNAQYAITSYLTRGIKPSAGRSVTLQVSEPINGTPTVTGEAKIKKSLIALDFDISSPRALGASRVVKLSGTPFAGKTAYAFLVKGTKGSKVLRRVSLGKTNACGYTRRKVAIFGSNRPSNGTYTVYVNTGKKLNKSLAIGKRITVFTRRTFR